ncbi:hypothetical protein [Desulfogranum marinum]|uniref:hypothetical protein n=1 Tax=Desulfogranum marinum TaxID=453220 RepID=UPI0019650030|nr:hypothetical protein [Desulfogranum marinum]MBM9513126.1 hypothetical protein [Desulfogranum marinum]
MQQYQQEVAAFLQDWVETNEHNKQGFERFYKQLQDKEKGSVEFHPRPGVTYSLRGMTAGKEAPVLYVMVDVIEDEPRWLSVCFYGAMITDPEEKGAFVPGGLLGEDAICFDLEEYNQLEYAYVEARIEEAYASAVNQ